MSRLSVALVAVCFSSACAVPYRSVVLPVSMQTPPASDTIEVSGKKNRTKVFDFEIRQVNASKTRGFTLMLGPVTVNKDRHTQERQFTIERAGAPFIDVNCLSVNQQQRDGVWVYYRHTYNCSGANGFELAIDQVSEQLFQGKAKLGGIELDLVSTIDFADGKQGWSPTGFHLRRNGRWLGTLEYYKEGKAYLAPDLTGEEHDAVLAAVVSISSTGRWFQLTPQGGVGKHAGF